MGGYRGGAGERHLRRVLRGGPGHPPARHPRSGGERRVTAHQRAEGRAGWARQPRRGGRVHLRGSRSMARGATDRLRVDHRRPARGASRPTAPGAGSARHHRGGGRGSDRAARLRSLRELNTRDSARMMGLRQAGVREGLPQETARSIRAWGSVQRSVGPALRRYRARVHGWSRNEQPCSRRVDEFRWAAAAVDRRRAHAPRLGSHHGRNRARHAHTHTDWGRAIADMAKALGLDPSRNGIRRITTDAHQLSAHKLLISGIVAVGYGALEAIEGYGLLRRRRWGEYLTIISTSLLFIPEIWELTRNAAPLKVVGFILNVIIVGYLVHRIRRPASGNVDRPAREV